MTRPWIIWLTAFTCVFIVLGAVGAMTYITLNMEQELYVESERERRVVEAVDQMEEYVEALLSRENSREASDFSPVQTSFNKGNNNGDLQVGNRLSPLFNEKPDNVKFYWYTDLDNRLPSNQIASPQLPSWGTLHDIKPNNDAIQNDLERNLEVNVELNELLTSTSTWSSNQATTIEEAKKHGTTNLGQLNYLAICASCHYEQGETVSNVAVQQELTEVVSNNENAWNHLNRQDKNDEAVLSRRLKSMTRAESNSSAGRTKISKNLEETKRNGSFYQSSYINPLGKGSSTVESNPYFGMFEAAEVAPFTVLWVNDELMLIRNVVTETGDFVQGVWLDKDKIKKDLILLAKPFLSNVDLKKVGDPIDFETLSYGNGDICRLDKFPFEIIPGEIFLDMGRLTPMRLNLLISWACVLLAIIAVSIMFKGVMRLSERRASFVSSVSHELRTPLTTFKLYSEMLADGMVKDPVKQQEYLEKLSRESDRLSHMVENVLSFSQIERGKSQRKLCSMEVGTMLQQLEPTLKMRLGEEDMKWVDDLREIEKSCTVQCDPTSFDQILTNLVDNAAKYGKSKEGESVVRVTGEKAGKFLKIRISDNGVGIQKAQEKRLFKAFHKSDIEAAHSKPGVGLGLALCRDLARSMGGDLLIGKCPEASKGACIEIILPLAKKGTSC